MAETSTSSGRIKVGVIADQTGPLSFVGLANTNVARMVVDDINAKGGLLGRELELYLEDSGISDPFSQQLLAQYEALYPGMAKFTAGSACSGLYRGLRFWAAAVTEAGSLTQADVIAALDHAQIAEGPGGPAAMVPAQHHARLNMYIAQARGGRFYPVESLGAIDPNEQLVPRATV